MERAVFMFLDLKLSGDRGNWSYVPNMKMVDIDYLYIKINSDNIESNFIGILPNLILGVVKTCLIPSP